MACRSGQATGGRPAAARQGATPGAVGTRHRRFRGQRPGGFSLRRAARAADTTHKVLLYHFDGADDLLGRAVARLRDKRIARGLAASEGAAPQTLTVRVRAAWPILAGEESWVHAQAIGLMMYDPARYGKFGRGSTR